MLGRASNQEGLPLLIGGENTSLMVKLASLMLKNLGCREEEPDGWKGFHKGYREFW